MTASLVVTVLSALRTAEAARTRRVRLLWPFPWETSAEERPGYFAGKIGIGVFRTIFLGVLTVIFAAFAAGALRLAH
jgi:hypothetical protein